MASELPHKGYLPCRGSLWATCVGRMAAAQRRRGSYAQKPTTSTPGRRRIFGKTGALHELDPRQEAAFSVEWRRAKNTLSGFSLRQGEHPDAMGAAGLALSTGKGQDSANVCISCVFSRILSREKTHCNQGPGPSVGTLPPATPWPAAPVRDCDPSSSTRC